MQGVSPDVSAASVHYLTAKLQPKDVAALKALFVRPGFVEEWNNLDQAAKEFSKQLTGKEAATPSATWKLFTTADPQAVLWLGLTSKAPAVQAKYKNFFTVWPESRQKGRGYAATAGRAVHDRRTRWRGSKTDDDGDG